MICLSGAGAVAGRLANPLGYSRGNDTQLSPLRLSLEA